MYPLVWWLFCIGILRALFSGIRANRHRAGFDLGRQGDWRAGRTCAYRSIFLPRGRSRSAKTTSKSICDSPKIKRVRFIIQVMPYRSAPFPDYPSWETQSRVSQRPTLPNAVPKRHYRQNGGFMVHAGSFMILGLQKLLEEIGIGLGRNVAAMVPR